jgi:hypothetical protein
MTSCRTIFSIDDVAVLKLTRSCDGARPHAVDLNNALLLAQGIFYRPQAVAAVCSMLLNRIGINAGIVANNSLGEDYLYEVDFGEVVYIRIRDPGNHTVFAGTREEFAEASVWM